MSTMVKAKKAPVAHAKIVPTPVKEAETPGTMEFSWTGVLTRSRVSRSGETHKTYLRSAAVREFLRQAPKNDDPFTYKDFQYGEDFGSGDFYMIKDFGFQTGTIQDSPGSAYRIVDHEGFKRAWNQGMEGLKFSER